MGGAMAVATALSHRSMGLLFYEGHVQANVHIVQAMVTQEEEDEEPSDSGIFLSMATWWEPGVCAHIYSNKHMVEKPKFN